MTTKRKPRSVVQHTLLYVDVRSGNTYHASRVYFDGVEVARVPAGYGGFTMADQNARDLPVVQKRIVRYTPLARICYRTSYLSSACLEAGVEYLHIESRVTKMSDLNNHGA